MREPVCVLDGNGEDVPVRDTVGERVLVVVTNGVKDVRAVFVPVTVALCVFDTVLVFVAVTVPRELLLAVPVFVFVLLGRGDLLLVPDRLNVRVAVAVADIICKLRGCPISIYCIVGFHGLSIHGSIANSSLPLNPGGPVSCCSACDKQLAPNRKQKRRRSPIF